MFDDENGITDSVERFFANYYKLIQFVFKSNIKDSVDDLALSALVKVSATKVTEERGVYEHRVSKPF